MRRVLVSSCLLGQPVRYDGRASGFRHPVLDRWLAEGRVLPCCPELLAGLPTPRPPAEIQPPGDGRRVLLGRARILDRAGDDRTEAFVAGAEAALAAARADGAVLAVLKENSPSCGSGATYDGTFRGRRLPWPGVTAARLQAAGIPVFSEDQLDEAAEHLAVLERGSTD